MEKIGHVLLNSVERVRDFANAVSPIEGDIYLQSGRYIIDGKSIMGIFSLDLSVPIKITVSQWNEEYEERLASFWIKV
ncbi:MAG: HPr family phosphocarrier protein [Floccifex porci]|uniref:HPr family phosphocarrier protein n=1 Tax=Floccifex porci TaxID=2606629 RepID=UPI003F1112CF